MGNIIDTLQRIFLLKEDTTKKVGISCFKDSKTPVTRPIQKIQKPKELKLSELMRKSY